MPTGTVRWYDKERGFGFVAPDDGDEDIFIHAASLQAAGLETLTEGQRVSYEANDAVDGRHITYLSIG
jgi:CspA family cold shock protein